MTMPVLRGEAAWPDPETGTAGVADPCRARPEFPDLLSQDELDTPHRARSAGAPGRWAGRLSAALALPVHARLSPPREVAVLAGAMAVLFFRV